MPSDKIIEHEERKENLSNKYLKKVSPFHLGVLLLFFVVAVTYFVGLKNLNNASYYLIGGGLLILIIYLTSGGSKGNDVDFETAQDLLEQYFTKRLSRIRHGLMDGEVVISPKGYPPLRNEEEYHFILFYIRDYEEGFKHWYVGRISKKNGSFGGCQDAPGDISGEPPIDYERTWGRIEEEDD